MAITLEEAIANHEEARRALELRWQGSALASVTRAIARKGAALPSPDVLRAAEQACRAARGILHRT